MTPCPKSPKCSEQCQDDCTGYNFVRKRAVSQIDRKQWGTKRYLDRFYVNTVLQDKTELDRDLLTALGLYIKFSESILRR